MYHQTGQRVVLVTGPSGAGRSTAINALEDLGYEAIDNLPLSLMPRLLQGPPMSKPLALGLDVRNRDFSTQAVIEMIDRLGETPEIALEVLYLDANTDVLLRRYSETRRRHPMAPGESPAQGIARESDLLAPIRARAEMLLDTSELSPHDLRAEMERWFAPESGDRLALAVHSFSYKRGLPRGIDMVFDCRFLNNPYWEESLRALNGQDPAVSAYVEKDPRFEEFFGRIFALAEMLLPAYVAEGKAHLSIGFGCTGGQHRSVAVTEKLARALESAGWQVSIRHRELERAAATRPAPQHKESKA
ncbi:RNase adapter RapZ [Cognatishimia sp. MH4019]|uniref:RNase adapter RapZ n=1 Tax=Cognatishimia sp. MH4019 TaxID=2854030 RepID=UPI001CD52D97|nr:RNase adapter RapZ [Cognatishimia sp. MH4019]